MRDDRTDPQASARFYGKVFGLAFVVPADAAGPQRMVTFDVPDVDAVASAAWQHGGCVVDAPADAGDGARIATLADPQGAVFRVRYAESVAAGSAAGAGGRSRLSPLDAPIAAVSSAIDLRSDS
jgi:predicted enzyme related to lactoylglutathione lyase